MSRDQVIALLGEPNEQQELSEEILDAEALVFHYDGIECSLFFDLKKEGKLSSIEIAHQDTILFETKVFDLNEKEITSLFRSKGYLLRDTETHPWGEKRLSFDEAGIECYFEHNRLSLIQCEAAYGTL